MGERLGVRIGANVYSDEEKAVKELFKEICQPQMEAVILFCSSHRYDLVTLGKLIKDTFPCTVIGCTTSGEISPRGYQEGGIVGASLSSEEIKVHPLLISPLRSLDMTEAQTLAQRTRDNLSSSDRFDRDRMFGFLMVDGLSGMEEDVVAALYNHFDNIPIIGGSAADDMRFRETMVYYNGEFLSDAALFTIFETTLPFCTFMTQHFTPTDKKMVITGADPSRRLVTEINAEPAAQEYARILGVKTSELNRAFCSRHPLMIKIGDDWYVRSIQKINYDNSLSFFCAIDLGLVMTLGEGGDMVSNLDEAFKKIHGEIPAPDLIIGCDCGLRKTEIMEKGIVEDMNNLLKDINFIGFSTYGEQLNCVHFNQTLSGLAIGAR